MKHLGRPITQRQLRVGEMIKQALGILFIREEAKIANFSTKEITVTEVRMSADLKTAKIFVMPLGGKNSDEIVEKLKISSFNIIYEVLDFIKNKMAGLLTPDVEEKIIGSAEILEIFKVSKVGKVAGSKVVEGEITQNSSARVIRDGTIIFNGKIGSIFREKDQTKQVSAGLECGITLKDFADYQKKDIIEVYNSTITERTI